MKIRNKKTGQIIEIDPSEASKYGITGGTSGVAGGIAREETSGQPKSNTLESLYNLTAKPTVQGLKGLIDLLGSAGATVGSAATMKVAPELSSKLADYALDTRQKTGMEGSFDQGVGSGLKTVGTGLLKGAAGVGAVANIAAPVTAGLKGGIGMAGRAVGKEGIRNLLTNTGLYGVGEGAKAMREGEEVLPAVVRGATGGSTTGPAAGIFGENDFTQAADVALSVGLPILLGKQIDKTTNKIVNTPGKFIKQIKSGITSSGLAQGLKKRIGDFKYKQGMDDIRAYMNAPKKIKTQAFDKGINLEEVAYSRGLDDTPQTNYTTVRKQSELANKELIKMAKAQKLDQVVGNDIFDEVADGLIPKATSKAEATAIDAWRKFNKEKYLYFDMDETLKAKKLFDSASYTKGGTVKSNAISKANKQVADVMRQQIKDAVDGAEELLRTQEESILLESIYKNLIVSKKGTTLKDTFGRLLNPQTLGREIIGGIGEKLTGGQKFGHNVVGNQSIRDSLSP